MSNPSEDMLALSSEYSLQQTQFYNLYHGPSRHQLKAELVQWAGSQDDTLRIQLPVQQCPSVEEADVSPGFTDFGWSALQVRSAPTTLPVLLPHWLPSSSAAGALWPCLVEHSSGEAAQPASSPPPGSPQMAPSQWRLLWNPVLVADRSYLPRPLYGLSFPRIAICNTTCFIHF